MKPITYKEYEFNTHQLDAEGEIITFCIYASAKDLRSLTLLNQKAWLAQHKRHQVSCLDLKHHDFVHELEQISEIPGYLVTTNIAVLSNDYYRPDTLFIIKDGILHQLRACTDKNLRFAHGLEKMYRAGAFHN